MLQAGLQQAPFPQEEPLRQHQAGGPQDPPGAQQHHQAQRALQQVRDHRQHPGNPERSFQCCIRYGMYDPSTQSIISIIKMLSLVLHISYSTAAMILVKTEKQRT